MSYQIAQIDPFINRTLTDKPPAFPPPFHTMEHQAFIERLPRWFCNQHEEHQMLLDELSGLWYARSLEYGHGRDGRGPTIRLVQIVGDNAEACLLIELRANGAPEGAYWDALFAIYPPGAKSPIRYDAEVYRKCSTNDRAALMAFLARVPRL